jgi:hypothetical protein
MLILSNLVTKILVFLFQRIVGNPQLIDSFIFELQLFF